MPAVSQARVMSAISVLEVQFDNNMQFLPESKTLFETGFTFGNEEQDVFCKRGFWDHSEAHRMR